MYDFDLIIFLIAVNIGFLILVFILFAYIIINKYLNNRRETYKNIFFHGLEEAFMSLLVQGRSGDAVRVVNSIKQSDYEIFIEFISIYLTNIKGADFDKIIDVLYKSTLFKNLCDSIRASNVDAKLYSIYCLGLMKKPVSINDLLFAMHDGNPFVRMAAIKAIAEIGFIDVLEEVLIALDSESYITEYKLSEILWSFGEEICPKLLRIFEKSDTKIIKIDRPSLLTSALIEIFGYWKYFASAEIIHEILRKTDIDLIRKSCLYSLGKMVHVGAINDVVKCLESKNSLVRLNAVNAMLELRAIDKIEKIKPLLNDADWNVRYATASALFAMNFDFQAYMFSSELASEELSKAYRTIVHVLTEKLTPGAG